MAHRMGLIIALVLVAFFGEASMLESSPDGARSTLLDNALTRTLRHVYAQCADSEDIFWCFKVQGARLLGRALKVPHINVIDGVTLVRHAVNETRSARASVAEMNLNNRDLENLSLKSLDALLLERFANFMQSHQLQVNLPRLLSFGERSSQNLWKSLTGLVTSDAENESEGRERKKDDKKYLGPFIAAVLLKAAILKMAYHSIAIVAGKALIVGKIALIISAIIGLKKLVSGEGGEKTTYEIVKHPQVQQSHTYSSSHQGEYEGGHEGGSYHRSMDDEMMMQDKAYHAWMPATKVS